MSNEQEDFFDELREYVKDIIDGEFQNVDIEQILEKLFERSEGTSDTVTDDLIYDVIEELGGEPYDPTAEESEYEEEVDEGDL